MISDSSFLAIIRYHWYYPNSSDPWYQYNITDNMARNNYYSNNYSPHAWADGNLDLGSSHSGWSNSINNESNVDAPLIMSLSGTFNRDSLVGYLNINVIVESNPSLNNLKLRVALTQFGIRQTSPNGTTVHHQVFRDMFPTTGGLAVTLPEGDTLNYTVRFTTPSPLLPDSLELVAFVQSDQNKRILQAAKIKVRDLVRVGIEDGIEVPQSFTLSQNYPNPFNAQTRIDFSTEGGNTALEIFDITGARVASLMQDNLRAGAYSVIWDGRNQSGNTVSSGTYFYRLKDDSGVKTMRMTLLK
jgi:hypothetical protein